MLYTTPAQWRDAPQKRVLLFGMSGLGKTHVSNMLRASGEWFHYSVDYRIGTRYMGEAIADSYKRAAMEVSYLRALLKSDSIYIASNITFDNLAPLSMYLGKPGDPARGGLSLSEYQHRQSQHHKAECAALLDTPEFITRAHEIYGYPHFVCDSGGSICEVVDPEDPEDPILSALSRHVLLVWIRGSDAHTDALISRFEKAPKPMYYQPAFLTAQWQRFLQERNVAPEHANPDDFMRFTYANALAHREPRYRGMSGWGVTVEADDIANASTPEAFTALIASALAP